MIGSIPGYKTSKVCEHLLRGLAKNNSPVG